MFNAVAKCHSHYLSLPVHICSARSEPLCHRRQHRLSLRLSRSAVRHDMPAAAKLRHPVCTTCIRQNNTISVNLGHQCYQWTANMMSPASLHPSIQTIMTANVLRQNTNPSRVDAVHHRCHCSSTHMPTLNVSADYWQTTRLAHVEYLQLRHVDNNAMHARLDVFFERQ